jgi:hypothetical protein
MSHNTLCSMTNGGFLYECRCDEPEYLEQVIDNAPHPRYN